MMHGKPAIAADSPLRASRNVQTILAHPANVLLPAVERAGSALASRGSAENISHMYPLLRFASANHDDAANTGAVATWFDARQPPSATIAQAWFARIRQCGDMRTCLHDGCPVACVDDAPFAYVSVFTSHVNIGFFHAASLHDPAMLLLGADKYMRQVQIKAGHAPDAENLAALIIAAYRAIVLRLEREHCSSSPS